MWEKIKSGAGLITSVSAVMVLAWGLVTKMGLIISRAEAQTIVELAVQQATTQTNQALLDEAKARQIADLNFQVEMVNQQIEELLDVENRNEKEEYQLEQLKKRIDQLNSQIAGLQQ